MTEAARSLASEEGLRRFQWILAAIDIWRDQLTPVQRRVLRAGGGPCAKITAARLVDLHLATLTDEGVEVTDFGRFVTEANAPKRTPSSAATDRSES